MQTKQIFKKYSLQLVEESEEYENIQLISSSQTVKSVNDIFNLQKRPEEYIVLLCLNNENYITAVFEVAHGYINMVETNISNILKKALLTNSNKIIICHNHPSGDVIPSKADYKFTDKLVDATKLLEIELLDHIIIGNDGYNSLFTKDGDIK